MNRRTSIKRILRNSSAFFIGTGFFVSCGGEKSGEYDLGKVTDCGDLDGLPEEEIKKRHQLGYIEKTPIADNTCDNCQLYLPPTADRVCGGCQLFKGPVKPEGYCTYWAPRLDHS